MPLDPVALLPGSPVAEAGKAGAVRRMPAASHAGGESADQLHAFGRVLGDAMQTREAGATEHQASQSPASAPTPAAGTSGASSPSKAADTAAHDDDAPDSEPSREDGQLDGGLQAFVNSLQIPVTAIAVPASADAGLTSDAATISAAPGEAVGLDSLAAGGTGELQAQASSAGDVHGKRMSAATTATATSSAADFRPGRDDDPRPGASSATDARRSRLSGEIGASRAASDTRASPDDTHAFKPAQSEAWFAETGTGVLPQAMAASASGTSASNLAHAAPMPIAHVGTPLHAPPWQEGFGQKLLWMARHEQQMASLTLNPPELGPMRVTLSIADGQASASFISLQPEVRQAIQDAVPRLKEMFADAGLPLQQASVGSGDAGDRDRDSAREAAMRMRGEHGSGGRSGDGTGSADDASAIADGPSIRAARRIAGSRLVDLFA